MQSAEVKKKKHSFFKQMYLVKICKDGVYIRIKYYGLFYSMCKAQKPAKQNYFCDTPCEKIHQLFLIEHTLSKICKDGVYIINKYYVLPYSI